MSFQVSYVANQPSINGTKQIYKIRSGSMPMSTMEPLLDTRKPVIIDTLELAASESTKCGLRIVTFVDGVQQQLEILNEDGNGKNGFYPREVLEQGTSLFEIVTFDTVNNKFKFTLKEPLIFPQGCIISVRNASATTAYNVGAILKGREY